MISWSITEHRQFLKKTITTLANTLFNFDPLLMEEIVINLLRKLGIWYFHLTLLYHRHHYSIEPTTCKKFFSALPNPPTHFSSVVTFYESSLAMDHIRHSSKLLTLACDYIGGMISIHILSSSISPSLSLLIRYGNHCIYKKHDGVDARTAVQMH